MGSHSLLQGIFPTQGSNWCLLHCRQIRYCLSHQGNSIRLQCRRPWFHLWVGKIPWRREWLPSPVFFPGEVHGQRSLADYSPWGCKEVNTTEWLTLYIYKFRLLQIQVFCTLNKPHSYFFSTSHPSSLEKRERAFRGDFEDSVWWKHGVPFSPKMGALVSVLSLSSSLVKGGLSLPTWCDPHAGQSCWHSYPSPSPKSKWRKFRGDWKRKVWGMVTWKGIGDSIETQHHIPLC